MLNVFDNTFSGLKSPLGVNPIGWIIRNGVIQSAPDAPAPGTPTLTFSTVTGPAGTYRITNVTKAVTTEITVTPPFDLADYGDPGDVVTVLLIGYSPLGPTVVLSAPPLVNNVAPVATLTGNTVTLSSYGTWTLSGIPVTPDAFSVTVSINGGAFEPWSGSPITLGNTDTAQFAVIASKTSATTSGSVTSNTVTYTSSLVFSDNLSTWLLTDTYTEINAAGKYSRAADAGTVSVVFASSAAAAALSGKRMRATNSSAGQKSQLKALDTVSPLADPAWTNFQLRGRVRVPGTREKMAFGWGTRSAFYGFFLSRNATADDGRVALLTGQAIDVHTNGTTLLTNQAASSDIEFLLDVPDRLTMRLRAWQFGGAEPGTWGATYTFGAAIDIQSGLLLGFNSDNAGDYGLDFYGWKLVIGGPAGAL